MTLLTREQAWDLVCTWIQSDSLRKHVLAVEAAMRAYARRFGQDETLWGVTGLIHDLDFERYPDMDDPVNGHPRTALIMAVAYVRPSKDIRDVEISSVKKKWKDKLFAAAVSRADIEQGAAELGLDIWTHVGVVLDAMKGIAPELGLDGRLAQR